MTKTKNWLNSLTVGSRVLSAPCRATKLKVTLTVVRIGHIANTRVLYFDDGSRWPLNVTGEEALHRAGSRKWIGPCK